MDNLVVGSSECSFDSVSEAFRSNSYGSELTIGQWIEFASKLEIPKDWIDQTKTGIILKFATLSSAIRETLELWRSQNGKKATLECLLNVLKQLGHNQIAENLKIKFKKEKVYVQRSGGLHMQIVHKKLCIVKTFNVHVTTRKLRDTCKVSLHIINSEEKSNSIAKNTTKQEQMYVLWMGQSVSDFLKHAQTFLDDDRIACIIIITNEDGKLVQNLVQGSSIEDKVDIITDKTEWSDLCKHIQEDILHRVITFQGNLTTIQNFCSNFGLPLEEILAGSTLCDLISHTEISLFGDKIPPRSSYYIQRRIIGRYNVDLNILKQRCEDVFLIIGIERHRLQSLLPKNTLTGTSQEFLQNRRDGNSLKHMTLTLKTDFDNIVSKTTHPVHILEYKGFHLKWIQSARSIKLILRHISANQSEVSENDFLESLNDNNKFCLKSSSFPIILSDTPGMGKSYLLQNIARQLQYTYHDRVVILLNLSKVVSSRLDQNDSSKDITLKWLLTNIQSSFEIAVVKSLMHSQATKIELLLDGFDEINTEDVDKITKKIVQLRNWKSIRIWITTRPHYLKHLEDTFNIVGYTIAPFTLDDQVQFLKKFWSHSQKEDLLNTNKLEEFGNECLRVLKKNITEDYNEFAGVPLQCFLLAEIYKHQACEFALEGNYVSVSEVNVPPPIASHTIFELYEKLVQTKLEIYKERYADLNTDFSFDNLLNCHMALALQVLFPDLNSNELEFEQVSTSELLKIGLLEHSNNFLMPQFIHRTLAEYFAALCVCLLLKSNDSNAHFPWILFNLIFRVTDSVVLLWKGSEWILANELKSKSFVNKVMVFMVDNIFAKNDYSDLKSPSIPFNTTKCLIEACVENNCFLLIKWFSSSESIVQELKMKVAIFDIKLISLAVSRSSLDIVTYVLNTFYGDQNEILLTQDTKKSSLLHIAAHRGNYSTFELLTNIPSLNQQIQENDLKIKGLVDACVDGTHRMIECGNVDQRIEILRLLFQINDSLIALNFRLDFNLHYIDVDLLKEIVLLSADTMCKRPWENKWNRWIDSTDNIFDVLFRPRKYLSAHDYHNLLNYIISFLKDKNSTAQPNWNEIFAWSQCLELLPETIQTLVKINVNFNMCFNIPLLRFEYRVQLNCLGNAVIEGRSADYLKSLVTHGAKVKIFNTKGMSLMHLAVCTLKNDIAMGVWEYLLTQGQSVNCRTKWRKTPLHFAAKTRNLNAVKFLITNGADVHARTLSFKTPLDYAKKQTRHYDINEELVQYLEQL